MRLFRRIQVRNDEKGDAKWTINYGNKKFNRKNRQER